MRELHKDRLDYFSGFHFFKIPKLSAKMYYRGSSEQDLYEWWSNFIKKKITIVKCFVRKKDVIKENNHRIIAKQFRILGEINE